VDGHVDPVGGHESGQGVVDGDGVDGVAAAEDVAEADIVCEVEIGQGQFLSRSSSSARIDWTHDKET
jgi:hypothetical protein